MAPRGLDMGLHLSPTQGRKETPQRRRGDADASAPKLVEKANRLGADMPDFDDVYQKAKRRHDDEMKQRAAAQETARAAREAEIDAAAKVLADSFLPVLKAARTTLKKNGLTLEIDGDDTA